ncbi:MAG: NUDIX domain-containing protein [Candidatus Hodarchaeales archaeon]
MSKEQDTKRQYDEVSCGGVPVYFNTSNKPEYLLVLHDTPHKYWAFPKGRQNEGETYKQTAIREISEETGNSNFEIIKRLISDSIYFPKRGTRTIVKKVVFFLVKFQTREVKLSSEHINWKWVSFEKALSLLTFDDYIRVLKESNDVIMNESII